MKKLNLVLLMAVLALTTVFQSCQQEIVEPNSGILPSRFKVDIPNSISGNSTFKSANVDTLQGNEIYEHLRSFIWIGENAADIVGEIITVISVNNLDQAMSFTFVSDDDGRLKNVEIIENSEFEGLMWEYQMTITDEDATPSTITANTALQIFWNNSPIKGIAILAPYNIDRNTDIKYLNTKYRIDYSEAGELGYEHHMLVTITGLPLENPLDNPYSISTLKMFVGKNGDVVSVYGNSEHPNATFINGDTGFDWAFTAAGKQSTDIGVAEVGLPNDSLDSSDRYVLLVENSIENVFTEQIYDVWPNIDSTSVQAFLYNTEAPGFFNHLGFIQGGTAPSQDYNSLLSIIAGLTPYNPSVIKELEVLFKE